MRTNAYYGWRPSLPDKRDYKYTRGITGSVVPDVLPDRIDLSATGFLPPVFDQGDIGSCTSNALAALFFFVDKKQSGLSFLPSRLFIYYNERDMEGTVSSDAGAELRDGIKTIVTQGACLEYLWPYRVELFAHKPPDICYTDAARHESTVYRSVDQTAADIQGCLAEGFPIAIGITVYDSFESDLVARTGVVPMPAPTEDVQGGHAILMTGYDNISGVYTCMNSWNTDWGMNGFFTIPQAYIHDPDLAGDFWMIHNVITPSSISTGTQ